MRWRFASGQPIDTAATPMPTPAIWASCERIASVVLVVQSPIGRSGVNDERSEPSHHGKKAAMTRRSGSLGPSSTAEAKSVLTGTVAATSLVRSEEHTSELQSLMRISYAVFCLKKK